RRRSCRIGIRCCLADVASIVGEDDCAGAATGTADRSGTHCISVARKDRPPHRAHGPFALRNAVPAAYLPGQHMVTSAHVSAALRRVHDPEIPVISVTDLGIVREVTADEDRVVVVVTPTYAGCPATEVIRASIEQALRAVGATEVQINTRLDPPWTTEWISPAARKRLREYGIAPPHALPLDDQPIFSARRRLPVECPRCRSDDPERLSQFGATACKALYRCRPCREPFEYFKPL